jgi:KDO2-lipid IV(A) lauroyltransferase
MMAFLYYLVIYPISCLPLWVLYRFADIFYILVISVVPYRRKVIRTNIDRSFPLKSLAEKRKIERAFYRHFADLLIESVKNLSIHKKELLRRFEIENPQVMEELFNQRKSVILVSGHYNNWEWFITAQALLVPHQSYGIGTPLSNPFWNKKLNERRQRFGIKVIHASNYKEQLKSSKEPFAVLTLADQSPVDGRKAFWTTFLNQPTAVLFGTEFMAHDFNAAVVYFSIQKKKRGFYSLRYELITNNPSEFSWGEITKKHSEHLEASILKKPQFWLWSHKRWKRQVPDDLENLKQQQKDAFTRRFFSGNSQ